MDKSTEWTNQLCCFAGGDCGSQALKKDDFRQALHSIKWKGDFEELWMELVFQIKEANGLSACHTVTEIPAAEITAFFSSDTYSFEHKIQAASASLLGVCQTTMSEFDSDGDGYISGSELERMAEVISSRSNIFFSPDDIKLQLDADNEGKISLESLSASIFGPYAAAAAKVATSRTPLAIPPHTPWPPQILTQPDEFLLIQIPPGIQTTPPA